MDSIGKGEKFKNQIISGSPLVQTPTELGGRGPPASKIIAAQSGITSK
jgi:hypothetical protein